MIKLRCLTCGCTLYVSRESTIPTDIYNRFLRRHEGHTINWEIMERSNDDSINRVCPCARQCTELECLHRHKHNYGWACTYTACHTARLMYNKDVYCIDVKRVNI